jgi:hypothetical protein
MALLKSIDPKESTGARRERLNVIEQARGRVPSMVRVMAKRRLSRSLRPLP